jgi:ferredoxin-NADP reductase
MAELKQGRIIEWRRLSEVLSLFRLVGEDGARFPRYEAGQYIALRRDDCLLTRKVKEGDQIRFVPDLDANGKQKLGSVTHSYSISSAPFETERGNFLEFFVVLERGVDGVLGRLTGSLFRVDQGGSDKLAYVERIVGDFTLAKRAAGFNQVLMLGTGTGVAPFASMIKQLHHEAEESGKRPPVRYTLIYANRTRGELAYHHDLLEIERSGLLDFVYVASVSRPTVHDRQDPLLGTGRANNLLRLLFDLPPQEATAVTPQLPRERPAEILRPRLDPARTVVLTCGNPRGMEDIAWIAGRVGMRFEKEDW